MHTQLWAAHALHLLGGGAAAVAAHALEVAAAQESLAAHAPRLVAEVAAAAAAAVEVVAVPAAAAGVEGNSAKISCEVSATAAIIAGFLTTLSRRLLLDQTMAPQQALA